MKKYLGYVIIIIIGVLSLFSLMKRCEAINNNISKGNNTVELFA